jgi:uncharacterized membrane protein YdcZ (DUF606 family)
MHIPMSLLHYRWSESDKDNGHLLDQILAFLIILFFVGSMILLILIFIRRNHQPIKKKSALLLIASVAGNALVILNICFITLFYHMVMDK